MSVDEIVRRLMAALGRGEIDVAAAYLAADVELYSPIFLEPFVGRDAVLQLLSNVSQIADDVCVENFFAEHTDAVLIVRIRVGDAEIDGANYFQIDATDLITSITVMWRPLEAVVEFQNRLAVKLGIAPQKLIVG